MVYVTHDQIEAMTLADRIIILNKGVVQQIGSSDEVYNNPKNIFVAGFIGSPKMNFINVNKNKDIFKNLSDNIKTIGIRAEHLFFISKKTSLSIQGIVDLKENLGEFILYYISINEDITFSIKSTQHYDIGAKVYLSYKKENLHLFDTNDNSI